MKVDRRKIIIDTDPGQDDAAAIMLALGSLEQLEILGFTAVAGNVSLDLTSKNIRKICELCNRTDIPVFEGASHPLFKAPITAEHVHGKTGLDGPILPEPIIGIEKLSAIDFIINTIRSEEENTITLCTLGALTNIALAFQKAPDIATRIKEIIVMGGGYSEGGNITPAAEFNFFVDPHAADIVLRSGAKLVLIPLDVTHQVLTSKERVRKIRELTTAPALAMAQMLEFAERFDIEKYGSDGGPLHDPNVIAYLLKPELYDGRDCNVVIEVTSELTLGMSVIDWWRVTNRPINAKVIRSVNVSGFFDLFTERLSRL